MKHFLVRAHEKKKQLGKPQTNNNIKIHLKDIGYHDTVWIHLALVLVNTLTNLFYIP
jgi:hypothetical protein